MGLFSGLVFCEDCGAKLYLSRGVTLKPELEYYTCSTNRKDRMSCTPHQIRNVVLKEIILQNLREAIAYISKNENDFMREATEMSMKKRDKSLVADKQALTKAEKRVDELDNIIKRLYEDNLSGKLTDERFMKFSSDYELEQENLKTAIKAMRQDVNQREEKKVNVKAFITAIKKYTDLEELDGAVIRELINKITISATPKYSKKQPRKISIEYNFIGIFDFNTALETTEAVQIQKKTA
jgi:hypothetical protein